MLRRLFQLFKADALGLDSVLLPIWASAKSSPKFVIAKNCKLVRKLPQQLSDLARATCVRSWTYSRVVVWLTRRLKFRKFTKWRVDPRLKTSKRSTECWRWRISRLPTQLFTGLRQRSHLLSTTLFATCTNLWLKQSLKSRWRCSWSSVWAKLSSGWPKASMRRRKQRQSSVRSLRLEL